MHYKAHLEGDRAEPVFASGAIPGIMLGYHLNPGGKWDGEYIIAPLSDFQTEDGGLKPVPAMTKMKVHIDRTNTITDKFKEGDKIVFPLQEAFEIYRDQIRGLHTEPITIEPQDVDDVINVDDPQQGRKLTSKDVIELLHNRRARRDTEGERPEDHDLWNPPRNTYRIPGLTKKEFYTLNSKTRRDLWNELRADLNELEEAVSYTHLTLPTKA